MTQNDKKISLLCLISQESYMIWSSFIVHLCNAKGEGFFTFFQIFLIGVNSGVKCKKWPKMTKSLSHSVFQGTYIMWSWILVCVKGWHLQIIFSFFQNFDFPGCQGSKSTKNSPKWQKLCLSHFISQELYLIRLWFLLHNL